MIEIHRLAAWLCVSSVLLGSCAVQTKKPVTDATAQEKVQVIIVDTEVQSWFDQALQALRKGELDTGIALLERVTAAEQRLAAPYVNLALAWLKKGDEKKAEDLLQKALKIDALQPQANNQLALLYRKQGKLKQARSLYEAALEASPDYLPAIRNLGILCDIYLRDLDCALEQYETLQQLQPEDKTVKIWLADLRARM